MPTASVDELFTRSYRHDPVTFEHSVRVGLLAQAMAAAARMPEEDGQLFATACSFHDVGKLLIPRDMLGKRLPLDYDERERIREHPALGARLVRLLGWRDPRMIATVRSHHERWDGSGYPDGLRGDRIPSWARMCAVIDAFDAMVHHRSYNQVKSPDEARDELRRQRGRQFDGAFVDLFLAIPEQSIEDIQRCDSNHVIAKAGIE